MKICPICRTEYGDELNFCLTDGSTLKDSGSFNPEDTISSTDNATLEYKGAQTANQNKQTNQTNYGVPAKRSFTGIILLGIFGLLFLLFGAIAAGVFYYRNYVVNDLTRTPTPTRTPYQIFSPDKIPTPQKKDNLKLEILEKVKSNSGQSFLKCKVTNIGETIARPFSLTLAFYKDDVMIKDNGAFVKLKYLKPQQSVPVWVGLYGTDGYTSVKPKDQVSSFAVYKSQDQIYLNLNFTETEMKPAYSTSYKVQGIVENKEYDTVSAELFVIFYDENKEIIGIETKRLSGLKKDEKTQFDVTISDRDLFGKPKSFELIPIAD